MQKGNRDLLRELTLTAAAVGQQLVPGVTRTRVAAQRVHTALLTAAPVRRGTLVGLWGPTEGRRVSDIQERSQITSIRF